MLGEILALASAFSFGLASVAIAKGARTSCGESGVFLSVIITTALSAAGWALTGGSVRAEGALPWTAVAWFAASGLLATVGGRITMFKAIEFAGVIRASTAPRLMPFLSLVLGWLVLGEIITPAAAGGMTLIAASFVLLYIDSRSKLTGTRAQADITRGALLHGSALGFTLGGQVHSWAG